MPSRSDAKPRRAALMLVAAAALAAGLQFTTSHRVSPLDPSAGATESSPPFLSSARAWAAPLLDTPYAAGHQPPVVIARLVVALTGAPGLAAAGGLLAALFVLVTAGALRTLGSRWLPALVSPLVLVAAGALRAPAVLALGLAWQALLLAAALLFAARCARRPSRARFLALVVVLSVAVSGAPSWWVLVLPVLACLAIACPRQPHPPGRLAPLIALALVTLAAIHGVVSIGMTLAAVPVAPGLTRGTASLLEVLSVAFLGPHWRGTPLGTLAASLPRTLSAAWLGTYGLLGAALAAAGLVSLAAARRHADAALVLGWATVGGLLVLVREPVDSTTALLLALVAGAGLVALGGTWLMDRAPTRAVRLGVGAFVTLPLLLGLTAAPAPPRPLDAAAGSAYAAALAAALEPGSAVVAEHDGLDRLVLRLTRVGASGRMAGPVRLPADADVVKRFVRAGVPVYAFEHARRELAARGVWFTEQRLAHASLGRYLDTQPEGSLVALAASGGAGEAVRYSPLLIADLIGGTRHSRGSALLSVCMLGRLGARSGAAEAMARPAARLDMRAGEEAGPGLGLSPDTFALHADEGEAVVDVAHRTLVRAESGVAIAILGRQGQVVDTAVVDASTGFELRVPRSQLALARAERVERCEMLGPGQGQDISTLVAGGAFGWSLAEPSSSPTPAGPKPSLLVSTGAGPQQVIASAHLTSGVVHLGLSPQRVVAANTGSRGLRLCPAPLLERVLFEAPGQRVVNLALDRADDPAFGAGWYLPENDDVVPFRWVSGEAHLYVRLAEPDSLCVMVAASPALEDPPPDVVLAVNGRAFASQPMRSGLQRYSWPIPADSWRAGVNRLTFRFSRTRQTARDQRLRAAAVRTVRVERAR